jgi:hypothetical protein
MKKSALIGIVVILGLAVLGGVIWAALGLLAPAVTDPAAVVPPGARFFMELDATRMTAEELAVADQYAAFARTVIGGEYEIPPMKDLAARGALVVYGSAKLQGMVPGVVIVFEATRPEAFGTLETRTREALKTDDAEERELNGWQIVEAKKRMPFGGETYLGLAQKGSLRIFATGKSLLEECLALADAGKREGTLAADPNFTAAFEGLPFPPQGNDLVSRIKGLVSRPASASQRVFLDLKGICDDIHPALSMFGGETYREIKEKFLVHLGSFAVAGGAEKGGLRSVSALRLLSQPDWLQELGEAKLEWPARAPEDAAMSFAMAVPKSLSGALETLMRQTAGAHGTAQIGQAHGVMGALNGALSMYFADHRGEYPVVATPTPIEDVGIVPTYMASPPKSPWGEPFLYVGDGTVYTLSARHGDETVTWYSSASGRVETAKNAAELFKEAAEEKARQIKTLLDEIREIGIAAMPSTRRGIEAFMGSGFPFKGEAGSVLGIRFESAEAAAEAVETIPSLMTETESPPLRLDGVWVLAGDEALVAKLGPAGNAASGFLRTRSIVDLALIVPKDRVAALPPAHRWTSTAEGARDGRTLIIDSFGEPDPMPAIFGAIAGLAHADKIDLPTLPRHGRPRNRPTRPAAPPNVNEGE